MKRIGLTWVFRSGALAALALAVVGAACGDSGAGGAGDDGMATGSGSNCTPGDLTCKCLPDMTCNNPKLACMGNICQSILQCGDGMLESGEECDDGPNNGDNAACRANCTINVCGDGDTGPMEACDDGNDNTGDGCSPACTNITVLTATSDGGHACIRISDGTLKCWGANGSGELGQGDTNARGDGADELANALAPISLGTGRVAVDVSAGGAHTCAILDDGSVKCWGDNAKGQLGLGDTTARGAAASDMGDALPKVDLGSGHTAKAIAASGVHTCALLDDGSVKCWGDNTYGELGQGDTNARGDDPGEMGDALAAIDLGGVTAVAIAVGSTASSAHSCALLTDGSVKCWGSGGSGQLGQGSSADIGTAPGDLTGLPGIPLGSGRSAVAIASGGSHVCALLDDDTMKCWGANADGQLGQGSTTPRGKSPGDMGDSLPAINLGNGRTVKHIGAGGRHSCAVLDDDTLKCWGFNGSGQLGLNDTQSRGDQANEMGDSLPVVTAFGNNRRAVAIAGGADFTCVRQNNTSIKCWGGNASGQLGQGDTSARGDDPGEITSGLSTLQLP